MVTRFFAAIGRRRRAILALGLTVAVVYVLAYFWVPALAEHAFPILIVLLLCVLILAIVAYALPRPRAFEVRPEVPAFSAPPSPASILFTLVFMFAAMGSTGLVIRDLGTTDTFADRLPALLAVIATIQMTVGIWRGRGIELRPDGLRDRELTGTLIVPWGALPAVPLPTDQRATLPVRYAHPELVRRRGLVTSRRLLDTDNIDRRLASQVIRYYVTHPEHRSAIGTRAEYDRLLSEISDPPPPSPRQDF